RLLTESGAQAGRMAPDSTALDQALRARPEVFETMHDILLFAAHNEVNFYTWGDEQCCLPKGATRATLQDDSTKRLRLRTGDVLIFEVRLGADTGLDAAPAPTVRHAWRVHSID